MVRLPGGGFAGGTFAARVSGSVLSAAGLPDLMAGSLPEHEALAARLARDPALLSEIRVRVARAKEASPLYDMAAFTRALEALYVSLASRPGE